jgi:N6-adenosine-specific RNA methylase IME4
VLDRIQRKAPDVVALRRALDMASTVEEVAAVDSQLGAAEAFMRESGLFDPEEMRPLNEVRMWARWKLGQLLAKVDRATAPGKGKMALGSLTSFLQKIGLSKPVALEAQRIGTMPDVDLEKALARCHKEGDLCSFRDLLLIARPYWYQASRQIKHKTIQARAVESKAVLGPFSLIYADPPWKFQTYSEKGLQRTPDQHYPTLTDDEIVDFKVNGRSLADVIGKRAALFLWCTSANLMRALEVMGGWGFVYKTHAIWDKERSGTGLVFRNQHEVLLYGIKGNMPGPQHQPRSVFRYPRGRHSAKPPEIRTAIERMYPDFDARTRLELFAREKVKGWTTVGQEAN